MEEKRKISSTFDVHQWKEQNHIVKEREEISPMTELTCWTKTSIKEGSKYLYGDRTGMLKYRQCPINKHLSEGYPHKYIRTPHYYIPSVEVIVKALKRANVNSFDYDLISFRNNLRKIFGTITDLSYEWKLEACILPNHKTIFLEIQDDNRTPSFHDADKFMYYGYKFETLCTNDDEQAQVDSTTEFTSVMEIKNKAGLKYFHIS